MTTPLEKEERDKIYQYITNQHKLCRKGVNCLLTAYNESFDAAITGIGGIRKTVTNFDSKTKKIILIQVIAAQNPQLVEDSGGRASYFLPTNTNSKICRECFAFCYACSRYESYTHSQYLPSIFRSFLPSTNYFFHFPSFHNNLKLTNRQDRERFENGDY